MQILLKKIQDTFVVKKFTLNKFKQMIKLKPMQRDAECFIKKIMIKFVVKRLLKHFYLDKQIKTFLTKTLLKRYLFFFILQPCKQQFIASDQNKMLKR